MNDFPIEYILISILCICCFFQKRSNRHIGVLTILFMVAVAIFRGEGVGTDYAVYIYDFEKFSPGKVEYEWERTEKGFMYLIYLFRNIVDNYVLFYAILHIIFIAGVYKVCRFKNLNWGVALFVLFFFGFYFRSLNAIRQFFGIGLVLIAVPLLYKEEYKKYMVYTLIVSLLFHATATIMLFLVPLHIITKQQIGLKKTYLYSILISSYLFFFFGRNFLYSVFAPLEQLALIDNYSHYVMNGEYREDLSNVTSTIYTIYALIAVYCSDVSKSGKYRFELLAVITSYVIFNLASIMAVSMGRLFLNFNIFLCFLVPLFAQEKKTFKTVLFIIATVCVSFATFYVQFISGNNSEIKPYYTIF